MLFDNAYIDISLYKGSPEILKDKLILSSFSQNWGAQFVCVCAEIAIDDIYGLVD